MTTQSDFKARVRERMSRTGERYAAARAVLIAQALPRPPAPTTHVQLLPGYERVGGIHAESAALANVLRQAGVVAPHTGRPFEESFLFGLAGGIGFMYFAFEYANTLPMLTVTLRSDSYPDAFVRRGLERSGATLEWHETGSATVAARHLDQALAGRAGRDLRHRPVQPAVVRHADRVPRVHAPLCCCRGRSDGLVALDDRAALPLLIASVPLPKPARVYRKGRHRLVTVASAGRQGRRRGDRRRGGPGDGPRLSRSSVCRLRIELRASWAGEVGSAHRRSAGSQGLASAARGRPLAGDRPDPDVRRHRSRVHAPAGGRPLYAAFLDEAADVGGPSRPPRRRRRLSGWPASNGVHSPVPRCRRPNRRSTPSGRRVDQRAENLDTLGEAAAEPNRVARAEVDALQRAFAPSPDVRAGLLAELAARATEIVRVERQALEALEAAVR